MLYHAGEISLGVMMLNALIVLATLIQPEQPATDASAVVTAECTLVGRIADGVMEAVGLRCPENVPEADYLQQYALTVSAQLAMPIAVSELGSLNQEPVTFHFTGTRWELPEPALLVRGHAVYPHAAGRRGLNSRCDVAVQVSAQGLAESHEMTCEAKESRTDRVRPASLFLPATDAAVANSRWFPPLEVANRCAEEHFQYSARSWQPRWMADPVENTPQC